MAARRATALRRSFTRRPQRRLLGQRGLSLAQIPGNPLELVVTGGRGSGPPVAVSPANLQDLQPEVDRLTRERSLVRTQPRPSGRPCSCRAFRRAAILA